MNKVGKIRIIIEQAISDYEEKYNKIYDDFYMDNPATDMGFLDMSEKQYMELKEECDRIKKEIADCTTKKVIELREEK